jgi:hypothetical protein
VGQRIEVEPTLVGDTAVFDTDRSITGQDGTGYLSADEAAADRRFPGRLAAQIFESDGAVSGVWVASNTVVVRRTGDWSDAAAATVAETIASFFVFYG